MTMTTQTRLAVKLIAGTVLSIGLIFGFLERYYAPDYIFSSKPHAPEWVGWFGWTLSLIASVAYIFTDILEWWARRRGA